MVNFVELTPEELVQVVESLMREMPYLKICQLSADLASLGWYENNPDITAVFRLTDEVADKPVRFRQIKSEYKEVFKVALKNVLKSHRDHQEAFTRIIRNELLLSTSEQLKKLLIGLETCVVERSAIPPSLLPLFDKTNEDRLYTSKAEFHNLLLDLVGQVILFSK